MELSPHGTLYHLDAWIHLCEQSQGARLHRFGVFDGPSLTGVFPLFIKQVGPFRAAGSPLVVEDTPYMGPVLAPGRLPELLRSLEAALSGLGVHFIRMILPPGWPKPDVEEEGYHVYEKTSRVLDLSPGEERLFLNLGGNCRTKIRKAERCGVVVSWTNRVEDWDRHYELLTELCRTQERLPPNRREFYAGIRQRFGEKGRAALVLSRYDGRIVAAQIYGLYKGTVYCINEASDPRFRHMAPNDAKHWAGISAYARGGYRFYDIGHSPTPNQGAYKRSFGGTEIKYYILERSRTRFASWGRRHYTSYRQYRSWMAAKFAGCWQGSSRQVGT